MNITKSRQGLRDVAAAHGWALRDASHPSSDSFRKGGVGVSVNFTAAGQRISWADIFAVDSEEAWDHSIKVFDNGPQFPLSAIAHVNVRQQVLEVLRGERGE